LKKLVFSKLDYFTLFHCQTLVTRVAKPKFSLPNALSECQIQLIWHFKMPLGNYLSLCDC